MNAVISVALPVFGIIAAGLLAGRLGLMSASDSAALNKFVFRFAMPAALFGLTAGTNPPGVEDAAIAAAYGAGALIVIFGAYFISQKIFTLTKQEAGAHALASILGNAVFLGLPIALNVDGWARPFVTLMLVEGIFVIAICSALMAPRREDGNGVMRFLSYFSGPMRNPIVVGMAAGFLFSALGFSLTGPIEMFFGLLGRAAGPTALFSMGLFLATNKFPEIKEIAGRVSAIVIAKMAVVPVIALTMARFFGVSDPNYLGALALFVLVPTGVGTFIMASQYKNYETETASAITITTILSVLTISTVLFLYT